jgi:hypothetical protein
MLDGAESVERAQVGLLHPCESMRAIVLTPAGIDHFSVVGVAGGVV